MGQPCSSGWPHPWVQEQYRLDSVFFKKEKEKDTKKVDVDIGGARGDVSNMITIYCLKFSKN